MSSYKASIVPILFLALAIFCMVHARDGPSPPRFKYDVHIINGCESGIIMEIQGTCRNEHGMVGHFELVHLWEQFHWNFNINNRSRAIYECEVRRGHAQHKTFIAFDQNSEATDRRCKRTGMCWWKITEVGIYFGNDNVTWVKQYNWD